MPSMNGSSGYGGNGEHTTGKEPMESWKIRTNDWFKELWRATKEMNY